VAWAAEGELQWRARADPPSEQQSPSSPRPKFAEVVIYYLAGALRTFAEQCASTDCFLPALPISGSLAHACARPAAWSSGISPGLVAAHLTPLRVLRSLYRCPQMPTRRLPWQKAAKGRHGPAPEWPACFVSPLGPLDPTQLHHILIRWSTLMRRNSTYPEISRCKMCHFVDMLC
jgi:hypothetical protein